jgi:hypothetical protein
MKTTTKTGKNVTVRIVKGVNTCHAVIVARNGRVIAESDTMRPRGCEAAAYDDARALAARI